VFTKKRSSYLNFDNNVLSSGVDVTSNLTDRAGAVTRHEAYRQVEDKEMKLADLSV